MGESHYQPALKRIAGAPRPGGWLVPCQATLQREPHNQYDEDAIAVVINAEKVGYISRDACPEISPSMDKHGESACLSGVPAVVRGGWPDAPSLGVMLWLNVGEVREVLSAVDWDSLEDFECHPWPPREDEGVPRAVDEPAGTGRRRGGSSGRGESDSEPRMPPLVAHYTAYVDDVKELKQRRRLTDVETLLLALVDAVEQESRREDLGVAPWYYEQLAIVKKKRGDFDGELEVLERFAAQRHASGAATPKLLARLEQVRARQQS